MPRAYPTIMLVDEQPAAVDTLSAYLEDTAYTLIAAADGESAWEMLVADPDCYDAVILDHRVSGPDGMPVFEKMQCHQVLQDVPAILQTEPTDQPGFARVEPDAVINRLTKPFDRAQLLGTLAMAMQNRVFYRSHPVDRDCIGDSPGTRQEATFTFKTIHSARNLASLLANSCPEPQRVVVGLTELLLNAVEHGNLGISFAEKGRLRRENRWDEEVAARLAHPENLAKDVWVEYVREPDRIRILIRDQGDGFDWRSHLEIDPATATGLHGRGIAIARMTSFDSIEYRGRGNEVEVVVETPGP